MECRTCAAPSSASGLRPGAVGRRLVRVLPADEGQQDNLHIEPGTPVLDVVDVVLDAGREIAVAPQAVDLGPAAHPGLHHVARQIMRNFRGQPLDMERSFGPRTDETHLTAKHIPKLWQLVEVPSAEERADPEQPRVVAGGALLFAVGGRGIRPRQGEARDNQDVRRLAGQNLLELGGVAQFARRGDVRVARPARLAESEWVRGARKPDEAGEDERMRFVPRDLARQGASSMAMRAAGAIVCKSLRFGEVLTLSGARRQARPMSSEEPEKKRRLPWVKIALAALVLLTVAVVVLRGLDLKALAVRGMAEIREAGPWVFFGAMAILPAFGMPMSIFTVPAGEAFGEQMGLGAVIAVSLAVVAFNLALGYWVARYALRPVLSGVFKHYGYSVPRVTPDNALQVALLVRLTPGPPYALQTGILGVAELPFRLYMIVSWLALLPWVIGAIILGRGLFNGNFGAVLMGVGVLVAATIVLQWIRRKYARRAR